MRVRWLLLVTVAVLLATAQASAARTLVTVDNPSPDAIEVAGGGYTVDVGVTNITGRPVAVRIAAGSPRRSASCGLTVTSGSPIAAAVDGSVTLTFDSGCALADIRSVVLAVGSGAKQTITIKPQNPTAPSPDWGQLWAFVWALLGGTVFSLIFGLIETRGDSHPIGLCSPLPGLPDTWSISDSLVTNVTAIGAVLTGVVGSSDVVKAILGADADSSVALATVGAAIALGILSLAVVVSRTFRSDSHFTVLGLMAAAAVTLAGAYGEIYVVWQNGMHLALGGWQHRLGWLALILGLLLLAYAIVSLREAIAEGQMAPAGTSTTSTTADSVSDAAVAVVRTADLTEPDQLEQRLRESIRTTMADPAPSETVRRSRPKSVIL